MNSLIIYYSRSGENYINGEIKSLEKGNTELLIDLFKDKLNSDTFKVTQIKPYSNDYSICIEEARIDKKNNIKPELIDDLIDISKYELILIAYPNYWGDIPMALYGLLEKLDFTNKKIIPICTHEGSGFGTSLNTLNKILKNVVIINSFSIYGHEIHNSLNLVEQKVDKFLKENNLL